MAEVGSAWLSIIPTTKGFGARLSRDLDGDMDRAGQDGGKRFGAGFAGSVKGLIGPAVAAAAGVAIGGFFKDAISGASDLAETTSKVGQVFGRGADDVQAFASRGAKALGQTRQQVLDASATFGTFGKAAGLSGVGLAKFSTGFAGLATDLASFSNTSPEQAVQAIGAALRGESEPIRAYGVLLDDATMRQEALRLGLVETTKKALTPQQKVLAAQALIWKQTKDAQGDFARTSGGLANQQRILSAQFSDFTTQLGAALLPVATSVVSFLNAHMVPAFRAVGRFVGGVVSSIRGFFAAGSGGASAFAPLVAFFQRQLVPAVSGVVESVRGFVAVALPIVQQFAAGMQARLAPLLPTIRAVFGGIGAVVTGALGLVQAVVERVTSVIGWVWRNWGAGIMTVVTTVFGAVLGVIRPALGVIQAVIQTVTSVIRGDWGKAWDGLRKIVAGAWDLIKATISGALGIIKVVLSAAWSAIRTVAAAAWSGLRSAVSTAWGGIKLAVSTGVGAVVDFVKGLPGRVVGALVGFHRLLFDKGTDLVRGLIDGIASMAGRLASFVAGFVRRFIPGPIAEALGIASPSKVMAEMGRWIPLGLVEGIESQRRLVEESMRGLAVASSGTYSGRGSVTVASPAVAPAGNTFQLSGFGAGWDLRRLAEELDRVQANRAALGRVYG